MAVELDELSGDVAGLIGYHLNPRTGMVHDDDIATLIRRYNIDTTCCGSVQLRPAVWSGDLVFYLTTPDEPPAQWTRRQVAFAIAAALIVAIWLGIALLFTFGVIDAANNGGTTR